MAVATLLRGLGRVERVITTTAFWALVALVFADVVARELTGAGLHWARQAGVYTNIVVVMLGLGLASESGAHLRPRFADHWLPRSWAPVLQRIQHALMAAFCLGFAAVALGMVLESVMLAERSAALRIQVWPIQSIIPLAFGIAFLRHGLYALFPALAPDDTVAAAEEPAAGRAEL